MTDRFSACCCIAALGAFTSLARAQGMGGEWERVEVEPCVDVGSRQVCVDVERQDIPDSPLFAFRGEAEVDLPLGVMAAVLLNDAIGPEWVALMNLSEEIRRTGEHSKIIRQGYDLDWPVQDRDYVLLEEAIFDQENRVFTLNFRSVEDPEVPVVDDYIRAEAITTYWRLSQIPDSDLVRVEVEVFTDPRGTLPPWLINFIQRTWPRDTIAGLYRRSAQGDIAAHPETRGW